ncbi:MAG: hypothetical protein LC799_02050, partial [Actinobacteria bacterium]|nr:hypothetical protein [Actinomycetota bacterium]
QEGRHVGDRESPTIPPDHERALLCMRDAVAVDQRLRDAAGSSLRYSRTPAQPLSSTGGGWERRAGAAVQHRRGTVPGAGRRPGEPAAGRRVRAGLAGSGWLAGAARETGTARRREV